MIYPVQSGRQKTSQKKPSVSFRAFCEPKEFRVNAVAV
jgi:hypothetical protein